MTPEQPRRLGATDGWGAAGFGEADPDGGSAMVPQPDPRYHCSAGPISRGIPRGGPGEPSGHPRAGRRRVAMGGKWPQAPLPPANLTALMGGVLERHDLSAAFVGKR